MSPLDTIFLATLLRLGLVGLLGPFGLIERFSIILYAASLQAIFTKLRMTVYWSA